MSHCKDHQDSADKTLGCYRLRFDNGVPVTDAEVLIEVDRLKKRISELESEKLIFSLGFQRSMSAQYEIGYSAALKHKHVQPDDTEGGAI